MQAGFNLTAPDGGDGGSYCAACNCCFCGRVSVF
jgi:hypothetical protein